MRTAESAHGSFSLLIRSPDAGESDSRAVPYGGVLHGNDRYAIAVSVDVGRREPLYLYVEQRTDAGIAPLLPQGGSQMELTAVGATATIPPSGFLNLDGAPGTVWIFAVAANQPLSLDQARNEIDRVANSGDADAAGARGPTLWGELDGRGIGVLAFKFMHR